MSILITGGAGYLGSYIIHELLKTKHYEIISYDIKDPNYSLHKKHENEFTHIYGDISDVEKINSIIKKYKVEQIIHLASPLTPLTEEDPTIVGSHITVTSGLLKIAKQNNIDRIIYASSLAVYGEKTKPCNYKDNIIDEETIPAPSTMYGFMKYLVENIGIHYYENKEGAKFFAPRFGVVIGPGRKTGTTSILVKIIEEIINVPDNDRIMLPAVPSTMLYWIHPYDVAEIVLKLLEYKGSQAVFNAYSYSQTIYELLTTILKILDKQIKIDYIEMNPFKLPNYKISNSKLVKELKFTPSYDLRRTIEDMFDENS